MMSMDEGRSAQREKKEKQEQEDEQKQKGNEVRAVPWEDTQTRE
jgi:hypothetical protein